MVIPAPPVPVQMRILRRGANSHTDSLGCLAYVPCHRSATVQSGRLTTRRSSRNVSSSIRALSKSWMSRSYRRPRSSDNAAASGRWPDADRVASRLVAERSSTFATCSAAIRIRPRLLEINGQNRLPRRRRSGQIREPDHERSASHRAAFEDCHLMSAFGSGPGLGQPDNPRAYDSQHASRSRQFPALSLLQVQDEMLEIDIMQQRRGDQGRSGCRLFREHRRLESVLQPRDGFSSVIRRATLGEQWRNLGNGRLHGDRLHLPSAGRHSVVPSSRWSAARLLPDELAGDGRNLELLSLSKVRLGSAEPPGTGLSIIGLAEVEAVSQT